MHPHLPDYFRLFFLAIIWSASFLFIKIGVGSIPPVTLTAARMIIAAVVLIFCLAVQRIGLPLHRRALLMYLVVGCIGNTIPFVLISWGETHIASSTTAILMGIMPITTFILAHYFVPSEPMTRRKVFGLGLGVAGLLTLIGWTALAGIGGGHLLGQLAVLGAAILYGVTTVFVRTQPGFPGVQMATGAILVGTVTGVPLAFILEDPTAVVPTVDSLIAIIILGVFPTAVAALLYFRVIRNLGATTFSQLNYFIPILGSIWGVLFLGEVLQPRMLVALALVLCGVYFIRPGRTADVGKKTWH